MTKKKQRVNLIKPGFEEDYKKCQILLGQKDTEVIHLSTKLSTIEQEYTEFKKKSIEENEKLLKQISDMEIENKELRATDVLEAGKTQESMDLLFKDIHEKEKAYNVLNEKHSNLEKKIEEYETTIKDLEAKLCPQNEMRKEWMLCEEAGRKLIEEKNELLEKIEDKEKIVEDLKERLKKRQIIFFKENFEKFKNLLKFK